MSTTQQLLVLVFMAATLAHPTNTDPKPKKKKQKKEITKQPSSSSSWEQIKSLLTCKQVEGAKVHDPSRPNIYTSCSSVCTFRDVVHGNTRRVVHRADNSPESSSLGQEARLLKRGGHVSSSVRSAASGAPYTGGRGMQLRKLSGCYECHAIVDPTRYPLPRTTICACSECGEVFPKIESLEHHQAVRHAVSELGPEDSSRNIVEIIFKSSWLKKDSPICKIERILKVHNTQRKIQRFEDYRDAVKTRAGGNAAKRDARCAADGNELLRFHCATLACSLGARGSSSLCGAAPACGVCATIRHGFQGGRAGGIRTTASSGRAHDSLAGGSGTRRAMLVCRVIAGRVRRASDEGAGSDGGSDGAYDSVAESTGMYSSLEELRVFSSRAILPCFVVIYKALEG
ncbi:C2H2-like zinc finger protein [Striga hermonthica]|uniref:C2H2-like zinc finger protein n=1 Tax=Striga hermonthica TaxID=68872 RepID=A0A9N7RQZ7_STRHE|nr:C2H2-like zinc finger protein [Striga hermonthica]